MTTETKFSKKHVIIKITALTKIYSWNGQRVVALQNVNLSISAGEYICIIGPSGSGKTTLLNLIGTLDKPTSGHIMIGGIDISDLKGDELADFRRANIGFVFQFFNLVPTLSALENVMLPLLPYCHQCEFDLKARAVELLRAVGLEEHIHRLPSQLSGGEQQRVAIARALINNPKIILADEPTGNLDSKTGWMIMKLLREVCDEQGVTIIVATHNQRLASFADQVYHLEDGKIIL